MQQLTFPQPHPGRRQRGTTLIELMVGLVILAVLAAIGIPSMVNWILSLIHI